MFDTKQLLDLPVSEFMGDSLFVEETAPVEVALEKFDQAENGAVVVCKPGTRILSGIITARNLIKLKTHPPKNALELSTHDRVIAIKETAKLGHLIWMLRGQNSLNRVLKKIPVVNEKKEVVGLINRYELETQVNQILAEQRG